MRCIILLLISFQCNAMSFIQASTVYQNLVHSNGILTYPGLFLDTSQEVNASSSPMRISVTIGMLRFTRNADELAMVLGHELAHFTLQHRGSTPAHEFAADSLGSRYTDVAGYSHCIGAAVLYRLHDTADSTHPDSTDRYNRVKCSK